MKAQLGSALLLVGFVLNGCGTSNPGADAGSDATMANDWVGSDQRIVPDLHPSDEMGQDTTSPPRPECQVMAPEVPLRRPVSTNEPMFIYNVYGAPETVGNLVELVPADLLPYFAVQIVPPEPYVDSPEFRAWIEAMVSAANEAKIPAFLQVEHMNTRNDLPQAFYEELFAKYSHFIGLSFAEISISGVAATALDDDYINRMKEAIVTASANGGYFLWQDMGYDVEGAAWEKTPQVFVKAGSDAGLFALMRAHATNLIFQDKHNGNGKRFTGPAAVLGLFTTCTIGQWGVNSEDWNWWEAGYGRLFAPWSGKPKAEAESWKSLFTFPEVLFGIDWLVGLSAGATVFAIEAPFHGFGPLDAATPSPAFEHVLVPFIRQIIHQQLIPTRGEVRAKIRLAYQPTEPADPAFLEDTLFQGLYGPEVSTICEWLPSTGRYYFLPILPVHSSSDMQALFPEVIQAADYQDLLATAEKRKALFDARYPLEEEGDAWVVHFGSRWFLANPRENQDSPVTFRLALATPPGSVLEGTLEAHTFAIVVEGESVLRIHLSNYRTDSDNGVWDNPEFTQEDPWTWFYGDYLVHPDDEETRRTTLILHASLKAEPDVEVQVTGQGTVTPEFDANAGTMTLRVDHNGVVELGIPVP